jgi:predicted nucleotidyltransferase
LPSCLIPAPDCRRKNGPTDQGLPRAQRSEFTGSLYCMSVEAPLTSNRQQVHQFLGKFRRWAASQSDVLAIALVGSYARNEATDVSDVDLVIVASDPEKYLQDTRWAQYFGTIRRQQLENYGKVTSLRVWYSGGHEVEYAFTDKMWCALPLDEGTKKVISDGMRILSERGSILSRLRRPKHISGHST